MANATNQDVDRLVEALDNLSAAMETVLLHQGRFMRPADLASRMRMTRVCREIVRDMRRDQ